MAPIAPLPNPEQAVPGMEDLGSNAGGSDARADAILSFDVEEHHRIEAASGLDVAPDWREHYHGRMGVVTRWLLDCLDRFGVLATFFIVGDIARSDPALIREIDRRGHEVGSHGWDHKRLHNLTPATFREDLGKSRDALEQVVGRPVVGYRAPTFSLVRQTAWAIDILAESGFLYDSSIYPIRHDRYGIPDAPRGPFLAVGARHALLEIPPATLDLFGGRFALPAGGGGYFRLFPLSVMEAAVRQARRDRPASPAMLYFHPWEFDPGQHRLPLGTVSGLRTYVGIGRSRGRLEVLLSRYRFARGGDFAGHLFRSRDTLPRFSLGS